MVLKGKVKSGLGDAWFWVKKMENFYEKKTGSKPYHGTLNVELEIPIKIAENCIIMHKEEYGGEQEVYIKPCKINGYEVYIVRSEKNELEENSHPNTLIEIISDVKLREKFNLEDGDIVDILLQ